MCLRADCVTDGSLPLSDGIIVGMTRSERTMLNKRFCGRVICYRCSASRHPIPPERVVQNPFTDSYERVERTRLHRVCDTCAPIVRGLATAETDNCPRSSSTIFTVTSPPMSRAAQVLDIHDPTASDLDDIFLIECPVCRTDLRVFEDDDLQAVHVATCLEGQSTSPSFGQGERHLGNHLSIIEQANC